MSTYDLKKGDKVESNTGEKLTVEGMNGVMVRCHTEDGELVELQATKVKLLDRADASEGKPEDAKQEKEDLDRSENEGFTKETKEESKEDDKPKKAKKSGKKAD